MARRKPTGEYVGKEALTLVRRKDGKISYVYKGDPVPAGVDDDELLRLLDDGFIVETKKQKATPASSTGSKPASTPSSGGGGSTPASDDGGGSPASDGGGASAGGDTK
ncbi:hypothetical protein [Microbacterium karelineae]|uniref:hypothetical protein n=1 Tax=Microbacterium karelineae TaxID=2654283 RepID=UPI0012EA2C61|nr:hypothetical protein [Microbacterium karelineae]